MFVTFFRTRCLYLLQKYRKKERLCRTRWPFYTAVAVSHGRDCFRRRWLFCTAVFHVAMAVSHALGRSVRFCTRQYSAKIVLSAKGRSVRFCTWQYSAKIVLSAKGWSICFCMQQSNTKFALSVRIQSIHFTRGNLVTSSYCSWKDGEAVFLRPDISFCYG